MNITTIGDLARALSGRTEAARLRSELERLTGEITSGRVADVPARVRGDFAPLAGIERDLARLEAYETATGEARGLAAAMQTTLESVRTRMGSAGADFLSAASAVAAAQIQALGEQAEQRFLDTVGDLGLTFAGQYVFSGTAVDSPPLASAPDMLAAIRTAVASETTSAGVVAAVDAWFGPGGGFEAAGYSGGADPRAPLALGGGATATLDVTAGDEPLRALLKSHALGALMADGPLTDPVERRALTRQAGLAMVQAEAGIVTLQAGIGVAEEAIVRQQTVNATQQTALQLARTEILGADPFERATELEAVQIQLESLYTLTARTARLRLTEFLR